MSDICYTCYFSGSESVCLEHPLNCGIVKEMNIHLHFNVITGMRINRYEANSGLSWFHLIEREESRRVASLSEKQRNEEAAKNAMKVLAEERRQEEDLKNYMLKKKALYMDSNTGMAKKKFNKPCKHEQQHGTLCKSTGSTAACPESSNCGCWPHRKEPGSCSFTHEDEHDLKAMFKQMGIQEGRCLFLDKKASKPTYTKPDENRLKTVKVAFKSAMQDAW